jgi:peptide/nickel transport system substrate-binding protein
MGLGENRNASPVPGHSFYLGPEWDTKWATLDPKLANKMLDDLGLSKKDSNGFRLRTDGKGVLILRLDYVTAYFQNSEGHAELIRDQWTKNIGIKAELNGMDVSLYGDRRRANKMQILVGGGAGGGAPITPSRADGDLAPLVADWYTSEGKEGVAPTPHLKRLAEIYFAAQPIRKVDRKDIYMEGFRIQIDEQYAITLNHGAPGFMGTLVKKKNFMNDPEGIGDYNYIPKEQRPDQFYFKGGKNDAGF